MQTFIVVPTDLDIPPLVIERGQPQDVLVAIQRTGLVEAHVMGDAGYKFTVSLSHSGVWCIRQDAATMPTRSCG